MIKFPSMRKATPEDIRGEVVRLLKDHIDMDFPELDRRVGYNNDTISYLANTGVYKVPYVYHLNLSLQDMSEPVKELLRLINEPSTSKDSGTESTEATQKRGKGRPPKVSI